MATLTGKTFSGEDWTPTFAMAIDEEKCIGCGRCYKVCPRDVFDLVEREFDEDYENSLRKVEVCLKIHR